MHCVFCFCFFVVFFLHSKEIIGYDLKFFYVDYFQPSLELKLPHVFNVFTKESWVAIATGLNTILCIFLDFMNIHHTSQRSMARDWYVFWTSKRHLRDLKKLKRYFGYSNDGFFGRCCVYWKTFYLNDSLLKGYPYKNVSKSCHVFVLKE